MGTVVYLAVCIGSTLSQTNAKVDALRALNPRVTVVVTAVECAFAPDSTPEAEDAAINALLASRRGVK